MIRSGQCPMLSVIRSRPVNQVSIKPIEK